MTRRQVASIAASVLVGSTLSGVVAYYYGSRRGASRPATSANPEAIVGPCVDFKEAGPLVGKSACVTGRVLKVFTSKAGNTFLDFCPDYRVCPFMSVVFSQDRSKFGDLAQLQGRVVEIRGLVSFYQDRAEIIIHGPEQIQTRP